MNVPFNDFQAQVATLRPHIEAAIARVLDRAIFILGPEVEAFERSFAEYLSVEHAVGVANGTDAIQLALAALDIGPGDEVICPALTAAPTALAVLAAGATPVFADIDPETLTLDPARLEECLTPRTKVILPVHLYGQPANITAIMSFANEHQLAVVEDCAQAHGAQINGRKVGTLGPVGCFSFYPTKNVGAFGDGGMVVTNNRAIAMRIRSLRDLGQQGRFNHVLPGLNSRLDEVQAAILQVKLAHLDEHNAARRERAAWYAELLGDLPGLRLPSEQPGFTSVYHLYVVRVLRRETNGSARRDSLRNHLRGLGIGSDVHYPLPLHRQPVFAGLPTASGGLGVSEAAAQEILSLPMYPQLTREQVEAVAGAIRAWPGH